MSLTYLTAARILDEQFGAIAPTVPATYYFALSTTTPVIAGTNFTEPTTVGTAYNRVAVDNDKVTWDTASSGALTNLIEIAFPESTLAWGTITYVGIYDNATPGVGNLLYFGALTPSRVVQTDTIVYFDIGDITASITN